ncbi:hypothetical protein HYN48_11975 [Flavobacterium magnum]|uniref:Uncharacterized protein n=1 Tax=Flavobacterium magnum TaxID=2162713 RepID=A0A2S0RHZ0_9FLAO|nr:hypothetical protein HYN48_11975 [Flavobacterium magnum]
MCFLHFACRKIVLSLAVEKNHVKKKCLKLKKKTVVEIHVEIMKKAIIMVAMVNVVIHPA